MNVEIIQTFNNKIISETMDKSDSFKEKIFDISFTF